MIDFACKKIELEEVIKCSLDLAKSDLKILFYLFGKGRFTSSKLASNLDLDLSTIQRSVKKLYEKDILTRSQKNLENGGYIYEYKIKDKQELKERIINIIEEWKKDVQKELQKL